MLACDGCGTIGGVRKRKCSYKVTYYSGGGWSLPYCMAPALCSACFKRHGGSKGLHSGCEAPAQAAQAERDADHARMLAGDSKVTTRWGSWHEDVPEGKVGCAYMNKDGDRTLVLVDKCENEVDWLSDLTTATPWGLVSV
jgi:hypothetical protein